MTGPDVSVVTAIFVCSKESITYWRHNQALLHLSFFSRSSPVLHLLLGGLNFHLLHSGNRLLGYNEREGL